MRTMGDAPSSEAAALPAGLQLVAGYVTGSPDIQWTAATWAKFPAAVHVTIDQGFTGAPRYDANVIDVETGAWAPSAVGGWMNQATAPRPTVYCNQSNLQAAVANALTSKRYKGDVWLANPGWQPGQPLPALPAGCRYVAVQNNYNNPAYDLSAVLDPNWPEVAVTYEVPGFPGKYSAPPQLLIGGDGVAFIVGYGTDGAVWYGKAGAASAVKLT